MKTLPFSAAILALTLCLPAGADSVITPGNLDKLQAASGEITPLLQQMQKSLEDGGEEERDTDTRHCDARKNREFIRKELQKQGVYDSVNAIAKEHGLDSAEQYVTYLQTTMNSVMANMNRAVMQNALQRMPERAEEIEAEFRESFPCISEEDMDAATRHDEQIGRLMQTFATAAQQQ